MARTMMFMWVFTLPFALDSDASDIVAHCIVVFLLTFAFMGLETVSLELDDPFGHDENDLDNLGLARGVFEDIYSLINIVDGPGSAAKLHENMKSSDASDSPATEGTALLGSMA